MYTYLIEFGIINRQFTKNQNKRHKPIGELK